LLEYPVPDIVEPAGAMAAKIERTDPVVHDQDVVILRISAGHKTEGHLIFQVHVGTSGPLPQEFTVFEHAAVRGDEIARAKHVCLFYLDSPHDPPFLVHDYR
jgi:hypothetical protein